MQLLYPQFLYALSLAAIPVILHLLQLRRYKKVVFSDITFLKQLQEQNKRTHSIREWLILAMRVLAIVMLVLAFARPYIPAEGHAKAEPNTWVSFYLDNSLSMQAGNPESLLDHGRRKIEQVMPAYGNTTRFQLLTNDFEGKHQRLVNKKEFLEMLASVKISPVSRSLQEVQQRQDALRSSLALGAGHTYWISDFQEGMDRGLQPRDSSMRLFLLPLASSTVPNVWIDSACFPEPYLKQGTGNKIRCWVRNQSKEDFEDQPLVLKLDGAQRALANITVGAGRREVFDLEFSLDDSNQHGFELSITDYPATFDDTWYLTGQAKAKARVLLLTDRNSFPEASKLYGLDPFYALTTQTLAQQDFSDLKSYDAVILFQPTGLPAGAADALKTYAEGGGALMLVPGETLAIQPLAAMLGVTTGNFASVRQEVQQVEIKDPLLMPAFEKLPENPKLPYFKGLWEMSAIGANTRVLMRCANDAPALIRSKSGKGVAFILCGPVDAAHSDLTSNALFVPLLLNLPLQVRNPVPSSVTLGRQPVLQFPASGSLRMVTLAKGKFEEKYSCAVNNGIANVVMDQPLPESGIYNIKDERNTLSMAAFNYARAESRQGFTSLDQLQELTGGAALADDLGGFAGKLEQELTGTHYWRWCLALALLALLTEAFLLRLWKK